MDAIKQRQHLVKANLGWMQFYLIRDRDYLTQEIIQKYTEHQSWRLYVLKRHEIENYLLDEEIIAKVQTDIFGQSITPESVRGRLKSIVTRLSGEVLREMVAFRLNLIYRPQDFSLGAIMENQSIIDNNGEIDSNKVEALKNLVIEKTTRITGELSNETETGAIDRLMQTCLNEVKQSLTGDSESWKSLFPGKRLIEVYSSDAGLGKPPALQNSLIKEFSTQPEKVPTELKRIIEIIANGDNFTHL